MTIWEMKTNEYSNITTDELSARTGQLSSKAEGIRQSVLKQCDELEVLYRELIKLKEELESRIK